MVADDADGHTFHFSWPSGDSKEPLHDYPNTSQGIASRASALLYVDGVTVSAPPEEALRQGINDVPLLLSSTHLGRLEFSGRNRQEKLARKLIDRRFIFPASI